MHVFRWAASVAIPLLVGWWMLLRWHERRRRDWVRAGYEEYARVVVDGIAAEMASEIAAADVRAWMDAEEDTNG